MREEFLENSKLYKKNETLCCEEKGKKLYLDTEEASFYRIKIDGGIIKKDNNTSKRCDFIVIEKENENIWIYVELKGNKLDEAYKQILETFNKYKENNTINYAAIVSSRCPKEDTGIQNMKKKFKKLGFKELFQKGQQLKLIYLNKNIDNPISEK